MLKRGQNKILLITIFSLILCALPVDARDTTFEQAEKLFLEGRYALAADAAESLIGSGSRDRAGLYYLKGLCELKLKKFSEARNTFELIIARYPYSASVFDAQIGIGDAYFLEGRPDNAAAVYKDILRKFPDKRNISVVEDRLKDCRGVEPALSADKGEIGQYSVQVGCFKSKRNAERMAGKLRREGYESYVGLQDTKGLYRVKAGKLRSEDGARGLASKLNKGGYRTKVCNDG